ncbi:hypothetical protein Bca4012_017486 [Brassica carinata]
MRRKVDSLWGSIYFWQMRRDQLASTAMNAFQRFFREGGSYELSSFDVTKSTQYSQRGRLVRQTAGAIGASLPQSM